MNRLKELREDKGLKQIDLAKKLNITQRNYSYIETEQTMLTADLLEKISDFYGVNIDYILYRTDVRNKFPKSIVDKEEKNV